MENPQGLLYRLAEMRYQFDCDLTVPVDSEVIGGVEMRAKLGTLFATMGYSDDKYHYDRANS